MERIIITRLDDGISRPEAFDYAEKSIAELEGRDSWKQGEHLEFEGAHTFTNRIGVVSGIPGYHVKVRSDEKG